MSKQRKITTTAIRQKLHQYIETAQDKKVKAIFALIEEEIEESSDHWQDAAFIADLEKSEKAYLNGTAKLVTIDQAVAKARAAIKKVKNKIRCLPLTYQKKQANSLQKPLNGMKKRLWGWEIGLVISFREN